MRWDTTNVMKCLLAIRIALYIAVGVVAIGDLALGWSTGLLFPLVLLFAAAASACDLGVKVLTGSPRESYYGDIVLIVVCLFFALTTVVGPF